MFFNEAQSAGALDHPNILRVYDAGEEGDCPYIVMEYVEGGRNLREFCEPERLLPVETVVSYMHQCARALEYAHRRGVMHRDIKPANVMLTPEGEVKIGDFGIAQRMSPDKTQLMSTFGSPRYMSPEQAQDEVLTPQTDLYSLGVSMYELLAGRPPFGGRNLVQLVNMIVTREPPPLRELRPDVPEALEQVILKCMAKSLDERYASGADVAGDLAEVFEALQRPPEVGLTDEQKFSLTRGLAFFNEFADDELEEVLTVAVWQAFRDGEPIITEGNSDQSFYIIALGDVTVTVGGQEVGAVSKGWCVGEMGYLSKVKRTASVIARGEVKTLRIDEMHMDWASLPCQVRFNKAFQRTLIERLAATTAELAKQRH
jgi:serine/threonine protein kinase